MSDIISYLQSNTDIDLTQFSNIENMWDILKDHINRNIKCLKVNYKDISNDINYLNFFNLDVLELCDCVLDDVALSLINVKKVLVADFDIKKEDFVKFGIYRKMNSNGNLNSFFNGDCLF